MDFDKFREIGAAIKNGMWVVWEKHRTCTKTTHAHTLEVESSSYIRRRREYGKIQKYAQKLLDWCAKTGPHEIIHFFHTNWIFFYFYRKVILVNLQYSTAGWMNLNRRKYENTNKNEIIFARKKGDLFSRVLYISAPIQMFFEYWQFSFLVENKKFF